MSKTVAPNNEYHAINKVGMLALEEIININKKTHLLTALCACNSASYFNHLTAMNYNRLKQNRNQVQVSSQLCFNYFFK